MWFLRPVSQAGKNMRGSCVNAVNEISFTLVSVVYVLLLLLFGGGIIHLLFIFLKGEAVVNRVFKVRELLTV